MDGFQLVGQLVTKGETQVISDKFKKREFVILVENNKNPEYSDYVKFQLTQDKCSGIEDFNVGDNLKVQFFLSGRKYEKDGNVNYFTNLQAWVIEKFTQVQGNAPTEQIDMSQKVNAPKAAAAAPVVPPENDLPF